jgi:hypothetical protein
MRDARAAAVSDDSIIIFGGVRNSCGMQEPLNDMWLFNLQHLQWSCIVAKTDDIHDPGKVLNFIHKQVAPFFTLAQNRSVPGHRFSSACAFNARSCQFVLLHGGTKPVLVRPRAAPTTDICVCCLFCMYTCLHGVQIF